MRTIDLLICDFVSMLEDYGVIKSMKFWSVVLSLLATLCFFMAGLTLVLFASFSSEKYFECVFSAMMFACIGLIWRKVGKECALRIEK